MIPEIDIWRTAQLMTSRHGDNAGAQAERRAAALLAQGDRIGAAVWRRIGKAIEELRKRKPDGSVH